MKSRATMWARVSARVHEADKKLLADSNYTVRDAIEYFNKVSNNTTDYLKAKEFFLLQEINEMKYDLIAKEMELEDIQKKLYDLAVDKLSQRRVDSYNKIIDMYNNDTSMGGVNFEDFIHFNFIQKNISTDAEELHVSVEEYEDGLIDFRKNVIKVGMTK